MLTVERPTTFVERPSSYALNTTPCGESFFEREGSMAAQSNISLNRENISTVSGNNRRQSAANNAGQHAEVQCSSVSPVSMTSEGMMNDHTSKDTHLLAELLDSSDDEWANTSVLTTNTGNKLSTTSRVADCGRNINSTLCNQQRTTSLSFQTTSSVKSKTSISLNSSFSPRRINMIRNNGNDSKLSIIWSNINFTNVQLGLRAHDFTWFNAQEHKKLFL